MQPQSHVDVDDPATWPDGLLERAQALAAELRGTSEYGSDLRPCAEDEDSFRALLGNRLVLAYHATRLLDHEVQMIRERGLRPLSPELVRERIESAYDCSAISAGECAVLHATHVFATGHAANRQDQVCLFLPRSLLETDPAGLPNLLGTWGGEAIYWNNFDGELGDRLRSLGRPSIVVAAIDLSGPAERHSINPFLQNVIVGRLLDLPHRGAGVTYHETIPSGQIVDVWQPGCREFDDLSELNRMLSWT